MGPLAWPQGACSANRTNPTAWCAAEVRHNKSATFWADKKASRERKCAKGHRPLPSLHEENRKDRRRCLCLCSRGAGEGELRPSYMPLYGFACLVLPTLRVGGVEKASSFFHGFFSAVALK